MTEFSPVFIFRVDGTIERDVIDKSTVFEIEGVDINPDMEGCKLLYEDITDDYFLVSHIENDGDESTPRNLLVNFAWDSLKKYWIDRESVPSTITGDCMLVRMSGSHREFEDGGIFKLGWDWCDFVHDVNKIYEKKATVFEIDFGWKSSSNRWLFQILPTIKYGDLVKDCDGNMYICDGAQLVDPLVGGVNGNPPEIFKVWEIHPTEGFLIPSDYWEELAATHPKIFINLELHRKELLENIEIFEFPDRTCAATTMTVEGRELRILFNYDDNIDEAVHRFREILSSQKQLSFSPSEKTYLQDTIELSSTSVIDCVEAEFRKICEKYGATNVWVEMKLGGKEISTQIV